MNPSELERLLTLLDQWDGSDLHLKAGAPPRMRINGELRTLVDEIPLGPTESPSPRAPARTPPRVAEAFHRHHEVDFAYSIPGLARFRVNAFYQRSTVALVFRRVRAAPASAEELGLPEVIFELAAEQRGLVLVTGPTGSGKTTPLASMVDYINRTRACHIVTIEDPIEYLHRDQLSAIEQREVGFDTDSFATASGGEG